MTQPNPYALPPVPTRHDEVAAIWQCVRRTLAHARGVMAMRRDLDVGATRQDVVDFLFDAERDSARHDYVYRQLRNVLDVWEVRPGTVRVAFDNLPAEDCSGRLVIAEVSHMYFETVQVFDERGDTSLERPSLCAPTYATSHRWGWPDERGVMRCACGAKTGVLDGLACVVHSPAIAIERMGFLSQEERNTIASNFLEEEQAHIQGRWRIALGLGWIEHVPAPTEQERCERLGVAWVGPDVQEMPNGDEERIEAFLRGHGVTVDELDGGMNGRWARENIVRSDLEELRALDEGRAESPRWLIVSAYADSGGIHRLGCELREADGVTVLR